MQDFSNPSAALQNSNVPSHRFSFTGTGGEYFLIWLVNVSLTILTLGIYGAWAKVRRERYFHGHTHLAGASFEYTAEPVKIFKGRLVLFGLVLIYTFGSALFPPAALVITLIVLVAIPWVMTQALRFRARYTTYRNISFAFTGTYFDTFLYFWLLKGVGILTLGLLLPFAKQQERNYVVTRLHYGRTPFWFSATVWDFFRVYLIGFAIMVAAIALPTVFVISMNFGSTLSGGALFTDKLLESDALGVMMVIGFLTVFASIYIVGYAMRMLVAKATWNNSGIAEFQIRYTVTLGQYLWIGFSNLLLRIFTLGLASPYCAVRMHRYKVENVAIIGPANIDEFLSVQQSQLSAVGGEIADAYDWDIDLGF